MASILDNPLMGILFGGSSYMEDRADRKRASEYEQQSRAALDQIMPAAQAQAMGALLAPQVETVNRDTGQTFITGGEQMQGQPQGGPIGSRPGLMNPQLQRQYAMEQEMIGSGIYGQDFAQPLVQQRMTNSAAMQRHMTMSPYEQAQLNSQAIQNQIANSNERWDDKLNLTEKYNNRAAPYIDSIGKYEAASDVIMQQGGVEGLNPADQLAIVIDYAQMTRPGEAMNQGDMEEIIDQLGVPGMVTAYKRTIAGQGKFGDKQMTQIVDAMRRMAQGHQLKLSRINKQYGRLGRERGVGGFQAEPPRIDSRPADDPSRYRAR